MKYYETPPQEIFDEVKKECLKIWAGYDDTYGYSSSKMERVKNIENIKENIMYMVGMFDPVNLRKLLANLSTEARKEITSRIIEVNPNYFDTNHEGIYKKTKE